MKALSASERGVHIFGQTLNEVSELMLQMPYMKSFDRMVHFFKILDCIGKSESLPHLASKEYVKSRFTSGNRRIALIHDYLMKNYREDVQKANNTAVDCHNQGSHT